MRNLLRFEFFKLKKSAIFYTILGIMIYLIFSQVISNFTSLQLLKTSPYYDEDYDLSYLNLSADMQALAFMSIPYLAIFIIIFSSIKALDDTRTGTIKNIISRGYTKTQIYFSKYIISLLVVLFYTVVAFVLSFLLGLIFFGNPEEYRVKYLFLAFIGLLFVTTALHSLNFGFASLFGNLAGAILFDIFGVLIIFSMLDGIIDVFGINHGRIFTLLDYMPAVLSNTICDAVEEGEIVKVFINIGVAIGYSMLGIGLGYLGSKNRQY